MYIQPGQWFIADVIGPGIYEMLEHGINSVGNYYAIVRCKKLFMKGTQYRNHETCCHPITDFDKWNNLKRVK